jgi:hypothetical protein
MDDDMEMIVPAGPTTVEGAALTLLRLVASCEGRSFNKARPLDGELVDRDWIFDTYKECIMAVRRA